MNKKVKAVCPECGNDKICCTRCGRDVLDDIAEAIEVDAELREIIATIVSMYLVDTSRGQIFDVCEKIGSVIGIPADDLRKAVLVSNSIDTLLNGIRQQ